MKVTTKQTAALSQDFTHTPTRPKLLQRHSSPSDRFTKHGRHPYQRPKMRHAHSLPRIPRAQATQIEAVETVAVPDVCPSLVGAQTGARAQLEKFADKALTLTLRFAEWFLEVLIKVTMERVGQRFGAQSLVTVLPSTHSALAL